MLQPLTEQNFRKIEEVGFDSVRIPVKPELLFDNFMPVDKIVNTAVMHSLIIVLDLHQMAAYKQKIE